MQNGFIAIFSNREISTALWLGIILLVFVSNKDVRQSMWQVVRAFCCRYILVVTFLLLAYVVGIVWILHATGAWTTSILKETIIWFIFSGVALTFSLATKENTEGLFKTIMVNNLKLIVVLEFLIGTYTFSLPIELIFVPMLTFLVVLSAFAKSKDEYASVAKFLGGLEAIVGITIVAFAIIKAITDFETIRSIDSIRRVLLAPVLSISLVPFIFSLSVYSIYEILFMGLRTNPPKAPSITRYTKRRLIAKFGLNTKRIRQFLRYHAFDMRRIRTRNDIDRLLDDETETNR